MVIREQTLKPSSPHPRHLDHHHRAALAAVESGRHLSSADVEPITLQLARLERSDRAGRLTAQEQVDPDLRQAWELRHGTNGLLRYSLEALLLTDSSVELIAERLSLSPRVIQLYRAAFFDTAAMPEQAGLLHHIVQTYQDAPPAELVSNLLWKIVALRDGSQALEAVMGQNDPQPLLRAAQYLAQVVRPLALQRLTRAIETLAIDNPASLRRLQEQGESLETELAESPQDDLAQGIDDVVKSLLSGLSVGKPSELPSGAEAYRGYAAELTCEEQLQADWGVKLQQDATIRSLQFPDPLAPQQGAPELCADHANSPPPTTARPPSIRERVFGKSVRRSSRRPATDRQRKLRRVDLEKLRDPSLPGAVDYCQFLLNCEQLLENATGRNVDQRAQDEALRQLMAGLKPYDLLRRHETYHDFLELYRRYEPPQPRRQRGRPSSPAARPPEPAVSQEPTDADDVPTEHTPASNGATTSDATAPSQLTDSTSTAGELQAQIARAERDLRELRGDQARQRRDEEEFLERDPTEACARAPGTPQERQLDQELIATLDQVSWDNTRMRRRKLRAFRAKHPDYRLANQRS